MQPNWVNNWQTMLTSPLAAASTTMQVVAVDAARLAALAAGGNYLVTLIGVDASGAESSWEIVKVSAQLDGVLTVVRGQEGTTPVDWPNGTRVEMRYTAGAAEGLLAHEAADDPHPQYAIDAQALPAGGTAGQVLTKSASADYAAAWADPAAPGGGLTLIAESEVTATARRAVMLAPLGTDNCSVIIAPRTGALQANQAGNQRGAGAVDLQHNQTPTAAVASGTSSTISGGSGNTASGTGSTVSGGSSGNATANYATVGGGQANSATTQYSTVGGGYGNTAGTESTASVFAGYQNAASALYSFVGAGFGNAASNDYSAIAGGRTNQASGTYGAVLGGYSNKALGNYSTVGAGYNNQATGIGATIGGGQGNTTNGDDAVVAGGNGNSATAGRAVVSGGSYNAASGSDSAIAGGSSNTADAANSFVAGGTGGTVRGCSGAMVRSSGGFNSVPGTAQVRNIQLRIITFDATPDVLTSNGLTLGAGNSIVLPDKATYVVKGTVIARKYGNVDHSAWEFKAVASRAVGAATTALAGTAEVTMLRQTAGAAAWTVTVDADTTLGALRLNVTGAAATEIGWMAHVESVEAVY